MSLRCNSCPPTCPTQCFSIRWLMHTHCGLRSSWSSARLCQTNHSGKFWEGGLSHLTQIKPGRKACLLLVILHLLDKASQGSSAALNWCTYPYLYWSSLWLGERGNLTGLAAIQALMPICLSSFMAELAFSGAIFQAIRDMVFSLSLPLLMQLYRVNIAGSQYMCLRRGACSKAALPFACLWLVSPPVSTSEYLGETTGSLVCAATMEIKC